MAHPGTGVMALASLAPSSNPVSSPATGMSRESLAGIQSEQKSDYREYFSPTKQPDNNHAQFLKIPPENNYSTIQLWTREALPEAIEAW